MATYTEEPLVPLEVNFRGKKIVLETTSGDYRCFLSPNFILRVFTYNRSLWFAKIDGPWYDDSSPEGKGKTVQEAIDRATEQLMEIYEMMTSICGGHVEETS